MEEIRHKRGDTAGSPFTYSGDVAPADMTERSCWGIALVVVFIQSRPSDEWIINHNLGYRPRVTLHSTGDAEIVGEVKHLSNKQARAYFAAPVAGSARCI